MKWYGLALGSYLLTAGLFYWGYTGKKQFNYPSKTFFNVSGLDVSHHQGDIDWKLVGKSHFKFVYIKSTEGASFKDKNFLKNYAGAKKEGLLVGGYHFWTFCKTAEEQIKNLKDTVPHSIGDMVPAIDIESAYGCGLDDASARLSKDLEKLNAKILATYGELPVVYTTREFAKLHPEIFKFKNIFWLRSLVGPPMYEKRWGIWQYYNGGEVKGIDAPVDVNVFSNKLLISRIIQK
ncbi:MAG: GH25 family lysozyme [Bdellovibrionales bacterium]